MASQTHRSRNNCPKNHVIKNDGVFNPWAYCSKCFKKSMMVYCCYQCNYNLCAACHYKKKTLDTLRNCPKRHGLYRFKTWIISNSHSFKCDECHTIPPVHSIMYGCDVCNFDLCMNCARGNKKSLSKTVNLNNKFILGPKIPRHNSFINKKMSMSSRKQKSSTDVISLRTLGSLLDEIDNDIKEQNVERKNGYLKNVSSITPISKISNSIYKKRLILTYFFDKNEYYFDFKSTLFQQGNFKNAYRATLITSNVANFNAPKIRIGTEVVLKAKKRVHGGPIMNRNGWSEDLNDLNKLERYTNEWNRNHFSDKSYKVSKAFVLKVKADRSYTFKPGEYLMVETFLPTFKKWNWPKDTVKDAKALSIQAFTHFTYHFSNRKELVTDAQGYRDSQQYILTDPYILKCTRNNYQHYQMHLTWFGNHQCNKFCKSWWFTPKNVNVKKLHIAPFSMYGQPIKTGNVKPTSVGW